MKRAKITLPDDFADLVGREAAYKPREISWAGLFDDPNMVPAERMDDELAAHWADDLDPDRR